MSIEERQQLAPEEVLDLWIHWERGPMLVDDVRGLPRDPLIVVEGTTVPAGGRHALWLNRPAASPDNPVSCTSLTRSWRTRGTTTFGSCRNRLRGRDDLGRRAAFRHCAAHGPRTTTIEERRALLREANETLVFQVRTFTARPWATETMETITRDFICECDDPECGTVLTVPVAEWKRLAAEGPVLAHAD